MGYALRFTVNWSDVVVMLPIASCVIVGAKFALEVLEFLPAATTSKPAVTVSRHATSVQVNEPANSPWTTVNQLLLGGRAPTNRLKPATEFSYFSTSNTWSTCCCDPSSLPPWYTWRCDAKPCQLDGARAPQSGSSTPSYTGWGATFPSFGFCAQLHTTSHHQNQGGYLSSWTIKI